MMLYEDLKKELEKYSNVNSVGIRELYACNIQDNVQKRMNKIDELISKKDDGFYQKATILKNQLINHLEILKRSSPENINITYDEWIEKKSNHEL